VKHCLVAALLVLVSAAPARADDDVQDKAQARLLLGQGNALFERGDLKGALADFRAAYAIYPSPKLLVNAAAAERELGDLVGAANDLRHFLDDAPDDDPVLVEKARNDLRTIERRVGRLVLSAWPVRTVLEVDGKPARDSAYVRPGEHHARARSPSGDLREWDVNVGAGETLELPAPSGTALIARPVEAAPPRRGWIVGVALGSAAAVAGGIVLGLYLGGVIGSSADPLRGDLGSYKFSQFR
jgi:tetratricopeptide (TPR) repeat protein